MLSKRISWLSASIVKLFLLDSRAPPATVVNLLFTVYWKELVTYLSLDMKQNKTKSRGIRDWRRTFTDIYSDYIYMRILRPWIPARADVDTSGLYYNYSGQYASLGPVAAYKRFCPLLRGLGYGMVLVSSVVMLYYNLVIAWTLYYMFASVAGKLIYSIHEIFLKFTFD